MTENELAIELFLDRVGTRIELLPEKLPIKRADAIAVLIWLHTLLGKEIKVSEEGRKPLPSPADDPDVQEALSRYHAPEVIRLLPLSSGNVAVFNHAGVLCGFER